VVGIPVALKLATGAWADALGATIGVDMGVGTSVAAAGVPVAPNTAGAVVEVDALHAPTRIPTSATAAMPPSRLAADPSTDAEPVSDL
jgi:hypothetical protein